MRHTAAHLLAHAVLNLYGPKVKFGIGPVIENGFYYDFDLPKPVSDDDLPKIEKEMKRLIGKKLSMTKETYPLKKAVEMMKKAGQNYKVELLKEIEGGERDKIKGLKKGEVSFYRIGDFLDLCKGGHVKSSQEIPTDGLKLTTTAGAYWKGSEKNPMLTRIYAVVFATKKELDEYLRMLEETQKRDHRKLGRDLKLFTFHELVGPGLPIWLPRGTIIKDEVEKFAKQLETEAGYERISTPHIAKEELFKMSGHLPYYAESMFPPMKLDDGNYYLKAMNCPITHLVFKSEPKSYRDFPVRLAEYGTVYRNELSGTLAGLLRVRMLSMNDAHIYCLQNQIEDEFRAVVKMVLNYFQTFGFTEYWFRLSKWDPKNREKYFNEPKNWEMAQDILRGVLKKLKVKFVEADNEAAFYGPKVDIQFKSAAGREESMSTIQLDFTAKERFGLSYQSRDGKMKNDIFVIHRAPLSTHERFLAFLIEHYAGAFPLWLAPVQAAVLPISDEINTYAQTVTDGLIKSDIRVELDDRSESIGRKIREAEKQKIPYMLIVGKKEQEQKTVSVRQRGQRDLGGMKLDKFVARITQEIKNKTL